LVFTFLPRPEELAEIYGEAYFQGGRADGYRDYAGSREVLLREFRRTAAHLSRFCPRLPERPRLLEIGAAYGFFIEAALPYFEAEGIELSSEAAAQAQRSGLPVGCGSAAPETLRRLGSFDWVVMLDTVEHLPSPAASLAAVHDLLRPGGHLCISTGDIGSPLARLAGRHWRLMTPPQRSFFFSRQTLSRLLRQLGFELREVSYPWKIIPLGLAAYQAGARNGFRLPWLEKSRLPLPVNLFDSMRVIARKG
jgi:SAM-dependent methyltransferase